jgi:3-oxoacyl-[acyl-carrier protein] reductase
MTAAPTYVPGHKLLDGKGVVITAPRALASGSPQPSGAPKKAPASSSATFTSAASTRPPTALAEAVGVRPPTVLCNVTREEDVQNLIDVAASELGGIDVIINNAGLGGTVDLVDMTDDQWNVVLDVTLNGTMRCVRAALRHMIARGVGGAIVNNASVVGWRAQESQCHYAAAKAGVMALTRCARDWKAAAHNVRINCVGALAGNASVLAKGVVAGFPRLARSARSLQARRRAVEVANVMVFLASDYAFVYDRRSRLGQRASTRRLVRSPRSSARSGDS